MPVQELPSTATSINAAIGVGAGDVLAQHKLLTAMLHDRGLISDQEVEVISKLDTLGHDSTNVQAGYFESRDRYNASPLALVIASCAAGSYSFSENPVGSGTVVVAKASNDCENRSTKTGGLVGLLTGGVVGAVLWAEIGGTVGHAVDKCLGRPTGICRRAGLCTGRVRDRCQGRPSRTPTHHRARTPPG